MTPDPAPDPIPVSVSSSMDLASLLTEADRATEVGDYAATLELLARVAANRSDGQEVQEARNRLESMAIRMRIEPGSEWLDPQARMMSSPLLSLLGSGEPLPNALVTIAEGPARVAVAGATVEFAVVAGEAEAIVVAQTTDFGKVALPSLEVVSAPDGILVRAKVVVPVGGERFDIGVEPIEFFYNAPSVDFGVIGGLIGPGDSSEFETADAPDLARIVTSVLRRYGSVTTHPAPLGEAFVQLASGSPVHLASAFGEADAWSIAIVVAEVSSVKQVELQGEFYDIWRSLGVGTVSLFDAGGELSTLSTSEIDGQGSSAAEATNDFVQRTGEALLAMLHGEERLLESLLDLQ